jgi:hypothetical protein
MNSQQARGVRAAAGTSGEGTLRFRSNSVWGVVVSPFLLATYLAGQAKPQGAAKGGVEQNGFTWTETYEGSGNTDGFITDINSTVGVRGSHQVSGSSRF